MAKPKRYYWMKLKESFMSSDIIDYFMSQPGGANYVVLYQILCLKTINTNGRLSRQIGEIIIPYDVSKIQRDTKWFSIDTVRTALNLYKMAGLIYEDVDGTLVLSGHTELVGSETESSSRMRKLRNKPSQTALEEPSQCDADCDVPVTEDAEPGDVPCDADTPQNVTTEIENRDRDKRLDTRDRDREKEGEGDTADMPPAPSCSPIPYDSIQGFYNQVCTSFPCCTIMNESRKKMIRARLRSGYTVEDFTRVFIKAENSSFLKGANSRNWTATFDWLIRDANMAKVLDGNFDDKKGMNRMMPVHMILPQAITALGSNPDEPFDLVAFAHKKADRYNQLAGNLNEDDGYDCPICLNKGQVQYVVDENGVPQTWTRPCKCAKTRATIRRMRRSGLKDIIRDYTFEKFQSPEPWQQTIKTSAEAYAKTLQGWFFIGGQSGSGKTHICTAICREALLRGQEVRYMLWRDEIPRIKSVANLAEEYEATVGPYKNAEILYIDDLFKTGKGPDGHEQRPTSADINAAFEILNFRYNAKLPTILSSECTISALLEIDEAVAGRIVEAAAHTFSLKPDRSRNYRLRKAVEL